MYVCLFDIDGTLLSSGGAGKAAIETSLAEEFGVEIRVKVPYSGRTDRAIGRDLFRHHGIPETVENWDKLLAGYLRRLPGCLNAHQGKVLPGIADLLKNLAALDTVALGLLTGNVRAGARLKLGHFGLEHHFPFGGFGDHHLDRNEVAREALAAVHRHLNGAVVPERVWVIGDTPLDIRCARAIGVRVAAVATGLHSLEELAAERPDLLMGDLADPEPLLARLNGSWDCR
jgi:phosphoglycolate phosphatase-like HAD superfamily hydrolase